jgi:hypothetical protein
MRRLFGCGVEFSWGESRARYGGEGIGLRTSYDSDLAGQPAGACLDLVKSSIGCHVDVLDART